MGSEKPSDEQSQEDKTKNRIGATVHVDVEGLDAKAIADMIHLVFRFNKKAEEIKDGCKS